MAAPTPASGDRFRATYGLRKVATPASAAVADENHGGLIGHAASVSERFEGERVLGSKVWVGANHGEGWGHLVGDENV